MRIEIYGLMTNKNRHVLAGLTANEKIAQSIENKRDLLKL